MSETPKCRTSQALFRLIFEDGKVGMVAAMPIVLLDDELEPGPVTTEKVVASLRAQADALIERIENAGIEGIYNQVTDEANSRRDDALSRAAIAREKHRQAAHEARKKNDKKS